MATEDSNHRAQSHPLVTRLNEDVLQCVGIILSQSNDGSSNRQLDLALQEWMRRFFVDLKVAERFLVAHCTEDPSTNSAQTTTTTISHANRHEVLRKEISDLQEELKTKDELIQREVSKLREFQDKADQLLELRDLLQRYQCQ